MDIERSSLATDGWVLLIGKLLQRNEHPKMLSMIATALTHEKKREESFYT